MGGASDYRTGNLATFTLWGKTYTNLPFNFSTATDGAFATREVSGHIGAGLLGRYTLVLDYPHERYATTEKVADPAAAAGGGSPRR